MESGKRTKNLAVVFPRPNTIGVMNYNNGDKYSGEWNNDQKNGSGEMEYDNGDHYEGEWRGDKKNKHGKIAND